MALPPEPLEQLRAEVVAAFVGTVVDAERVEVDPSPRAIGDALDRPAQQVTLRVSERLMGEAAGDLSAIKPAGAYVLVQEATGVFVLDAQGRVLGRQGPDTWSKAEVLAVFAPNSAAAE